MSKIIDSLKPKTSAGPDNISNNLIKIIKQEIVPSLTIIINQSLEIGIFPDSLKIAKAVQLFKKDDPTTVNNYRPISLLDSIPKIFEKSYPSTIKFIPFKKLLSICKSIWIQI